MPRKKKSAPPDNRALAAALENLAREPDVHQGLVFRRLLESRLIVMLHREASSAEENSLNLPCIMAEYEGGIALICFTDVRALKRFTETDVHVAGISARTLCRMGSRGDFDRLLINPSGPHSYEVNSIEMRSLAEGLAPTGQNFVAAHRPVEMLIGMPEQRPPDETLARLRQIVSRAEVTEAWWFWTAVGGGEPHLGLGIQPCSTPTAQSIAAEAAAVWSEYDTGNPAVDVMPLNESICDLGERLFPAEDVAA